MATKPSKFLRDPLPRGERNPQVKTFQVTTRAGNMLQFFYNPTLDLVVVDLIDKSKKGGNELVRKMLDEQLMLGHLRG